MRHLPGIRPPAGKRVRSALLISVVAMAVLGVAPTASATPVRTAEAATVAAYSGSLPNGTTWKAEIPADWNGTLVLYSHGYLPTFAGAPNLPADAPDPQTGAALLAAGYGLTGSSYAAAGWALNTAPQDQLDTLDATVKAIGRRPHRVLAVGTSMGGLVTAKLAEIGAGRIQGALPTCGIVGGGAALGNYQLDGAFALARLLLPQQQLTLTRYPDVATAVATSNALIAAVKQAQTTAEGRARIALAAALYQEPDWLPGQQPPAANDPEAIELGQYQW